MTSPSTQSPPRPRRGLYYGWVIVATLAVVNVAETAEFNPVMGVFLKPITEELGWSRAIFAGAVSLGTLGSGLLALLIGPLLDRWGPRWILFVGFMVLGATIMGMAAMQALWHFYGLMFTGRAVVSGAIAIATGVVISKWFIRHRGRAMALSTTGTRIGNAIMPLFVQLVINVATWRVAAIALGALTWAITLLPTALFLRRQPEDLGLRPDGDPPSDREGEGTGDPHAERPREKQEISFTVRQALRTRAFYLVLFASSAGFFIGSGVNFNLFAYLTDQNIDPTAAVTVITAWSLVGSVGGLAAGFFAERIHVRYLMFASYGAVVVGVFVLTRADSLPMAYLFALVHGLTFGGIPLLQQLIWADYFGRRSQGAIRGIVTPVQMVCNALGPVVAAQVFDASQSYIPIFQVFMGIYVVAALAMLLAKPPTSTSLPTSSSNLKVAGP